MVGGMVPRNLLIWLLLTACDLPSAQFRGEPATRIEVDGSVFDVRVRENLAEAVRVNAQYAPRLGPIGARAAFAMAQVSGCRVSNISGDQAMVIGKLSCGNSVPAPPPEGIAPAYSCVDVDQWVGMNATVEYTEFECDPIPG